MSIPTSIKVGPYHYGVEFNESKIRELEHEREHSYSGYTDHTKLMIYLDPKMAEDQRAETLWHEVKHAVCKLFHWDRKLTEEEAIRRTAPMELAVLRENPILAQCLLDTAGRADAQTQSP